MKIDDVITRVQRDAGGCLTELEVEQVARATVRSLGLEIADDGEVYDPAPKPAPQWEFPQQQNVRHYRGSRRR